MSTEASNGALVEETRALIKEVEAGSTDRAAWVAIQDRVKRLLEGRTQAQVGEDLAKAAQWVSIVAGWDSGMHESPWIQKNTLETQSGDRLNSQQRAAKSVFRDPEQRRKVIADLNPEERAAVIDTVFDVSPPPTVTPPKRRGPGTTWSALWSYLRNAERGILDALDAMKDHPEPPEEVKAGLIKWIDRLEEAIVVARAHLDNPDGMINEIEAFLAEAAEAPIDNPEEG